MRRPLWSAWRRHRRRPVGRRPIIWFSILGALPFTLILPYADLFWTGVLTIVINLIMSSAFAAILIYALELLPGRVGLVSGFFYGVTFGLAGIAAALLGGLADQVGIETVTVLRVPSRDGAARRLPSAAEP